MYNVGEMHMEIFNFLSGDFKQANVLRCEQISLGGKKQN